VLQLSTHLKYFTQDALMFQDLGELSGLV
jgi:hypothetical protein